MSSGRGGLGDGRLQLPVGDGLDIRRRGKLYWLHTLWVLLLIVVHLHAWWSIWALRAVGEWTYALFVYVVIGPGALVIASHIIIPDLLDGRIDVDRFSLGQLTRR